MKKDEAGEAPLARNSTAKLAPDGCFAESTREIAEMIGEFQGGMFEQQKKAVISHPDYVPPKQVLNAQGGQASLRRVLKAYSVYDREIGYCQGMNFIAGMFLTLMPEEESFWLLVGTWFLLTTVYLNAMWTCLSDLGLFLQPS